MFGIIERRAREPLGMDHIALAGADDLKVGVVAFDVKVLPYTFPKIFDVGHRPLPQIVIIPKKQPFFYKEPIHVVFQI